MNKKLMTIEEYKIFKNQTLISKQFYFSENKYFIDHSFQLQIKKLKLSKC